jgi:C4-dicarboxylate transporter DctM subunit
VILAGIFLAGISGSGPADVAILGTIAAPLLLRQGYSRGLVSGLTALAGSIGIIVPPSIALLIYGAVTPGMSIERLFLGGVVPGVLMGCLMAATVPFLVGSGGIVLPTVQVAAWPRLWRAFLGAGWALLFPLTILGGIYLGLFTPTESAAVAVVYAVFVSVVIYRELTLRDLLRCLAEAARVTAGVMILVACAAVFARILTLQGAAAAAGNWLGNAIRDRWLLLLGVNLLLLSAGCFLDTISIYYILVPILVPVLVRAGFDPVHLGVIFTVNLAIGQVTPPVGVNLFVSCGLSKAGIGDTMRASWPLLAAALLSLVLTNLFPSITLWLPNTMQR